jgi:hypothetical protein
MLKRRAGLALVPLLLVGCAVSLKPTTLSTFSPANDNRYAISAEIKSGALVFALDPHTLLNDGAQDLDMRLISSGSSGLFERRSVWEATLIQSCLSTFTASYRVRYSVWPFIPLTRHFFAGAPLVSTVDRAPATILIIPQAVFATRTRSFSASVRDALGCPITSATPITWSSSNPAIATVNSAGAVTGVSPGNVTITAQSGPISGSVDITVGPGPTLSGIAIQGADPIQLEQGQTAQLTVTATWSDGVIEDVTATGMTYASSSAAVTVSSGGNVRGVTPVATPVTVTASYQGATDTVGVRVLSPITRLTITKCDPVCLSGDSAGLLVAN